MHTSISQSEASEIFGIPTEVLYVCDGKRECGKASCADFANRNACHHTKDSSHALYDTHEMSKFERYPATRDGGAALILVEPVRG